MIPVRNWIRSDAFPRILPFAVYILFLSIHSIVEYLAPRIPLFEPFVVYGRFVTYPVRMVFIVAALIYYRRSYSELAWGTPRPLPTLFAVSTGVLVYLFWIRLDTGWMVQGQPGGFDPTPLRDPILYRATIAIRFTGATIVVPIIEELFWRSFLMRYLIRAKFLEVPVGSFSWFSFVTAAVLFGVEHDLWFAGILAGIAYAWVAARTKSIPQCILAHAVTNGLLGVYVVSGGHWQYW